MVVLICVSGGNGLCPYPIHPRYLSFSSLSALLLEWKDHPGNPQRVRLFDEVAVKLSSKIDKQHKLCITSALVKPSPDQV